MDIRSVGGFTNIVTILSAITFCTCAVISPNNDQKTIHRDQEFNLEHAELERNGNVFDKAEDVHVFKRAPSNSFFGVRGKKAPSGFVGIRGKKDPVIDMPDEFWDSIVEPPSSGMGRASALVDKRAPSGFVGMRGKKEREFENGGANAKIGYDQYRAELESLLRYIFQNQRNSFDRKRAPASAFYGMRGKKFADFNTNSEDYQGSVHDIDQPIDGHDKRAPSSGFFGVRGKRDANEDDADDIPAMTDALSPSVFDFERHQV